MANLKNTSIDNNLELPSGTTGERPSSPQEGQIRYNTDLETAEFYNGENWRPLSDTHPEAEGGTVVDTDIGGVPYRIHLFTETGTDTLTVTNPGEVEYLIVAGGGGTSGSAQASGGGGGGGVLLGSLQVSAQSYSVVVGNGGPVLETVGADASGENSAFAGVTAIGGGGGGSGRNNSPLIDGFSGGSGGGGGSSNKSGTSAGGSGTSDQGNDGGTGNGASDGNERHSGGGGGAGSTGKNASISKAGDGGQGILSNITGNNSFYGGGGGGGGKLIAGRGGLGGGGGGGATTNTPGTAGETNTGGGGGSGFSDLTSATQFFRPGGSGIVIVRYPRNSSLDSQPDETRPSFQPYNYARDVRPIVSRTGLVLELDAANPLSYPGTGSTWRDLSGIANNGSLENGVSYDSVNRGVLVFDGSNQYVGMGKSYINSGEIGSGNVSYTLEAWFKLTGDIPELTSSVLDGQSIIGSASGGGIGFQLRRSGNNVLVNFGGRGNSNYDSNGSINQNEWYHVVCTRQVGENNRIYIDGELDQTSDIADLDVNSTGAEMQIGYADGRVDDQYFEGEIAVARLYNTFLTDEQVLQNFNAERGRYGI